jgi:hypothetical protein
MEMQYNMDGYGMPDPAMGGHPNGMGGGPMGGHPNGMGGGPMGGGPMGGGGYGGPNPNEMMGGGMHPPHHGGGGPPEMECPPAPGGPYLNQLIYERQSIDVNMLPQACALIDAEIDRLRNDAAAAQQKFPEPMFVDIMNRRMKLVQKIAMPAEDYPQLNFGGHIIGKSGENIKKIATDTNCRVMIFGRGSINNRQKEEQLLHSGDPKYAHLCQQLHVHCETLAVPGDAYYNISMAINAIKKQFEEVIEESGAQPQFQQRGGGRGMGRGMGGGRGGPGGGGRG